MLVIKIKNIEVNNRNNSLNLLRLIFAIMVLVGHSYFIPKFEYNIPQPAIYFITLAVPLFFVVSGYLITGSAIKNSFKTFIIKRFARIYPGYFVSIVMVFVLFAPITYALMYNGFDINNYLSLNPSPINYLINGIFYNIFTPIGDILTKLQINGWNTSTWTLFYEFLCYILIGSVVYLLKKLKIKNFTKIIVILYLFMIICSVFYPRPENPPETLLEEIEYFFNFSSIFLGGSIVYLIRDKLVFNKKYLLLNLIFCIIIMKILNYGFATEICAIPMTYIILYLAINLKSPKFIQKNDISYGIYIYSWPIQTMLTCYYKFYNPHMNVLEFTIISLIISIVMGLISWYLVEKPILNKVRSI